METRTVEKWGTRTWVSQEFLGDLGGPRLREYLIGRTARHAERAGMTHLPGSEHVDLVWPDDPRRLTFVDDEWPEGLVLAFTTIRCYQS